MKEEEIESAGSRGTCASSNLVKRVRGVILYPYICLNECMYVHYQPERKKKVKKEEERKEEHQQAKKETKN